MLLKNLKTWIGILIAIFVIGGAASAEERRIKPKNRVEYQPPEGSAYRSKKRKLYDRSYAVVIGIDNYEHLNDLGGAVRDARFVAKELEERGFEVELFLDQDATKQRITEYLGDIYRNKLTPGDRVLVYFAGHGVPVGKGPNAMGYLMPVDAKANRETATGISMNELQGWFSLYPSQHVMFVADACFSGLALSGLPSVAPSNLPSGDLNKDQGDTLDSSNEKIPEYLKTMLSSPVRITFTAGGSGEVANEWAEKGHGLFTWFFLKGIQGAADLDGDKLVMTYELAAYLKRNVMKTAMEKLGGKKQNPKVGRSGEGEFVFVAGDGAPDKPGQGGGQVGSATVRLSPNDFDKAFWDDIKTSNNPDMFVAYLKRFPEGWFSSLAEAKIRELDEPPRPAPAQYLLNAQYFTHSNTGVSGELKEGDTMTAEDNYYLTMVPDRETYVYIAQEDASGSLYRIFPNPDFSGRNNPLPQGQSVRFPQTDFFFLDENTGRERIYILKSQGPMGAMDDIFGKLATADDSQRKQLARDFKDFFKQKGPDNAGSLWFWHK